MNYILKKRIFCVVFLAALFIYSGINCYQSIEEWTAFVEDEIKEKEQVRHIITELDSTIVNSMYERMSFIELYSYMQVLLGKNEFNNFTDIKDEKGFLHYASFFREEDPQMFEYAQRVRRLQDYVKPYGTKVIFMVTAGKYVEGETEFATGLPVNNPNSRVDELLFYLNRLGINTIDCRKYIPNENITYEEAFFKTDHHWTAPAAFEAARVLIRSIDEFYGENLDPDDYWLNLDNFERVTYYQGMCGSMGRKTGGNFVGLDDFTAYWPKYRMRFSRQCLEENGNLRECEGDISEVLITREALLKGGDIYSSSQYALYLDELRTYEHIVNLDNQDAPSMFAIRDSYFSPVMTFVAPMFSQMDAIWSLETSDQVDIESYVRNNQFDYIVIEVYPYNINNDAFNYFKEEG